MKKTMYASIVMAVCMGVSFMLPQTTEAALKIGNIIKKPSVVTSAKQTKGGTQGIILNGVIDLPYAVGRVGHICRAHLEGTTIVVETDSKGQQIGSDDVGKISSAVISGNVNGVIWKSGADHYFTFVVTNPATGEMKLTRHEGLVKGVKYRDI